MSFASSIAALGSIADLPQDFVMPSAEVTPQGPGWVRLGDGVWTDYVDVQAAMRDGVLRKWGNLVMFPRRACATMSVQEAIAAGYMDQAAATALGL